MSCASQLRGRTVGGTLLFGLGAVVTGSTLFVLDVGHGNCAAIVYGAEAVVIDAARSDALIEFVKGNAIDTISTIAVSHSDADHLRGVVGIVAAGVCKVGRVLVNPD